MNARVERKTCDTPDGVPMVYSAVGTGEPALVFIHGGLANRGFWDGELRRFGDEYRVLAPDLPGHGESGADRQHWVLPEFGADVAAMVEAEGVAQVILFGNSLGGPVAIEAALLLREMVLGVVGVDTFQSLAHSMTREEAEKRAEAFRDDYAGSVHHMILQLFHADADPGLLRDAQRRMMTTPPEAAYAIFNSLAEYRPDAAARRLTVPLRAINGDLYSTDVQAVRQVKPDFAVKVLEHTGHYPMLERPLAFDQAVAAVVEELIHHGVILSEN